MQRTSSSFALVRFFARFAGLRTSLIALSNFIRRAKSKATVYSARCFAPYGSTPAHLPLGSALAAQPLLAADLAFSSCVFWGDLRLLQPLPCAFSVSPVCSASLHQSLPRTRLELGRCLSSLCFRGSRLGCGIVRGRRLTRWRTLAFILRGEIRALAEDGFLELLLNTTRSEEITVPMISGILLLPS